MDFFKKVTVITALLAPVSINAAELNASALISGTNDAFLVGPVTVNELFTDSSPANGTSAVSINELASFKGVGQSGTVLGQVIVDGDAAGNFSLSQLGQGNHLNESRFQYSELITNSSAVAQLFNMDFLISAGRLRTNASEVAQQGSEFLQAEYGISISFGGVELFGSSAILRQTGTGEYTTASTLQLSGTSINGVYSPSGPSDFDNEALYTWGDYIGNLDLGALNPGESGLLEYNVFVRGSGQFDMCGSSGCGQTNASIGDPLSLSSEISPGSINSVPLSAVPVPAAVWLFSSGLIGLIGVARRKKA